MFQRLAVNRTAPAYLQAMVRPHVPGRALRSTTSAARLVPPLQRGVSTILSSVLLVKLGLLGPVAGCPDVCTCYGNTSDCSGLGLISVATILPLPQDTVTLSLAQNNVSSLGVGELANLSSLEVLDLSQNSLSSLQTPIFSTLGSLSWLNLSSNRLGVTRLNAFLTNTSEGGQGMAGSQAGLSRVSFQGLFRLRALDLSNNSLLWLPVGLLDELQSLVWLSLSGNRFRALDRGLLEPLLRLEHLQLSDNPWQCDCQLRGFKHWIEWMVYRGGQVDSVRCRLPVDLQGRDIRSVPAEMFTHCLQHQNKDKDAPSDGGRPPCSAGRLVSGEDCVRHRYRPVSVRRAHGTQVVAGVVCGTVCVMMVVAATYGCVYASLMARYQRQGKNQGPPLMAEGGAEADAEEGPFITPTSPEEAAPKEASQVVYGYRISSF